MHARHQMFDLISSCIDSIVRNEKYEYLFVKKKKNQSILESMRPYELMLSYFIRFESKKPWTNVFK